MSIIIFEGPNGSCKTTLAKKVSEIFNLQYIKESKPTEDGFTYYIKKALERNNCVLDRFHLGEFVYPRLKNDGRKLLEYWQIQLIDRILLSKNCLLVYCNTDYEFKKNVFLTRGEEYVKVEEIEKESALFDDIFNNSILNKIIYNINNNDQDKVIEQIVNFIDNKKDVNISYFKEILNDK
jgi:thymidylate kinase